MGCWTDREKPSPQGDGDPGPMRMTLADDQQVWLLWRNEVVVGVFGSETAIWKELMEMQAAIGGVWDRMDDYARVWMQRPPVGRVTLRMEPREVHR